MKIEPWLFFLLISLCTGFLYLLPFIPALLEWKNKSDAAPNQVNFEDRSIVEYSIRIFMEYIKTHCQALINEYKKIDNSQAGILANGQDYFISGKEGLFELPPAYLRQKETKTIILACNNAILPAINYKERVYALKNIEITKGTTINELVAEGSIKLNKKISLAHLLYSNESIVIDEGALLNNYVKAKEKIVFLGEAEFQYLHANRLEFNLSKTKNHALLSLPKNAHALPRTVVNERLVLSKNSIENKHFVVKSSLLIHEDCKIAGSIKSYEDMVLEKNCQVQGALFSKQDIHIYENCFILGPIIATGTIRIGKNCRIGTPDIKTSIIADNIIIEENCLISGMVLAKIEGKVLISDSPSPALTGTLSHEGRGDT